MSFKTFKRSATNWEQFARARKITDERGLSYDEAKQRCDAFNNSRTPAQIKAGTKLEFTQE